MAPAAVAQPVPSAFAPLRNRLFRRLWAAGVVSNLGFWMQQIAAAWLMTQLTGSTSLVALLATAAALPTFLLALPAGALADVLDRRKLIIATQAWQMAVAGTLGVLALADAVTPGVLLAGIAAYGLGATLGMPPQSAILPELVERDDLPQAMALNSTGFTAAQAIGPALGGILVASVGPGWAFIANAASFLGVMVVFITWRRVPPRTNLPAEHILSAIRTGARYVAAAPAFRLVLLRLGLHMACYAAIPGLLVVAVRTELDAGAGGYGVALAAFGLGGVLSALLLLPRLRARTSVDRLTAAGAIVMAFATLAGVAVAPSLPAALPGLFVGGAASMLTLSSLQAAAQQALPDWVRGRGLAIVQLTFQAAMAGGAAGWGVLAAATSVSTALLAAAATLIVGTVAAILGGARLGRVAGLDLTPACAWAGSGGSPGPGSAVAPQDGPVLIQVEYDVAEDDTPAFLATMRDVSKARRRDGAMHWGLTTDVAAPTRHLESYLMSSWAEHERERTRVTQDDLRHFRAAAALHRGDGPSIRRLLGHHGHLHLPHLHVPRLRRVVGGSTPEQIPEERDPVAGDPTLQRP